MYLNIVLGTTLPCPDPLVSSCGVLLPVLYSSGASVMYLLFGLDFVLWVFGNLLRYLGRKW